jgi:hypothetical protein
MTSRGALAGPKRKTTRVKSRGKRVSSWLEFSHASETKYVVFFAWLGIAQHEMNTEHNVSVGERGADDNINTNSLDLSNNRRAALNGRLDQRKTGFCKK